MLTPTPPRRRLPLLLSAVLLGTLLGFGTGSMTGIWMASSGKLPGAPVTADATDGLTLLVMGTDAMGAASTRRGNTDTMLLVHVNRDHHKVSVLSIPRDTRVPIPGHRTFKINAANPWGGPELAVETVSRFLKVPIDRYLLVDLAAVEHLVDALGGIRVNVPKPMSYVDRTAGLTIDLEAGDHRLNGEQVQSFLRFRHDGMGDIGRVSRQQDLIREAMPQVMHPLQWVKFPRLWAIVRSHSETDLTSGDVLTLAGWLNGLDPETDVDVETLPGHTATIQGLSYWVPDRSEARMLVRRLTRPSQVSAASPNS